MGGRNVVWVGVVWYGVGVVWYGVDGWAWRGVGGHGVVWVGVVWVGGYGVSSVVAVK